MPKQNTPQFNKTVQLVNTGQIRIFVQLYTEALDSYEYYGRLNLTDNVGQARTESDLVFLPSDDVRNEFIKVGEIVRALERGTTSFTQVADQELVNIWYQILNNNTTFNVQLLIGDVQAPDDFTQWRSKILLGNSRMNEVLFGENANPQTPDDNALFNVNGTMNYFDYYPIGTVELTDLGGSVITKSLVDTDIQITTDQRASEIFAATVATAVTNPSAVVYVATNNTSAITQTDITALGTDGELNTVAIAGTFLLGLQNDGTTISHVYSTLDDVRNANDNFTQVTAGYNASGGPNAAYVANSANIFIAGNAGYIYRLPSVTNAPITLSAGGVTVQNLSAIDGFGQQVVAVGASSAIVVSNNFGSSFASASAPTAGLTITAVQVVGQNKWFIGTGTGELYYTDNGGESWTQITLAGNPNNIVDIQFYAKNTQFYFGYVAATDGTNTLIYRTDDSGNTFGSGAPYLRNVTSTFSGVAAPTGLAVYDQNEIAVVGGGVLAHGINP